MDKKKKKPKFNVLNLGFFKSVKPRWRKPRGTHNKKRIGFAWTGASPNIGYGTPASLKGLHPQGLPEVLVNNVAELDGLTGVLVRIASKVGAKKRQSIEEKAASLKLKVLNSKVKIRNPKNKPKVKKPEASQWKKSKQKPKKEAKK